MLTPEELVRQSFIFYLMEELQYPRGMIEVEREVRTGQKRNRSDIRVLQPDGSCFMLIECKSFKTRINQQVFDQAAKYAGQLEARYLVTTNGVTTYCCEVDHQSRSTAFLDAIPGYRQLNSDNH